MKIALFILFLLASLHARSQNDDSYLKIEIDTSVFNFNNVAMNFYRTIQSGITQFGLVFFASDLKQGAAGSFTFGSRDTLKVNTLYTPTTYLVDPAKSVTISVVVEKFFKPEKYTSPAPHKQSTSVKFTKLDGEYFDGIIGGFLESDSPIKVTGSFHIKKNLQN